MEVKDTGNIKGYIKDNQLIILDKGIEINIPENSFVITTKGIIGEVYSDKIIPLSNSKSKNWCFVEIEVL